VSHRLNATRVPSPIAGLAASSFYLRRATGDRSVLDRVISATVRVFSSPASFVIGFRLIWGAQLLHRGDQAMPLFMFLPLIIFSGLWAMSAPQEPPPGK
jgi:hypothetical protein